MVSSSLLVTSVLEGTMGLVGGREAGYGPGMWIYEDAGARHEGTFQKSKEDLVYLANIYGPVMFDTGPGTQILVVASFMDYVNIAAGSGQPRPCRKPITTATTSSGVSGISWAWSAPAARRSWDGWLF